MNKPEVLVWGRLWSLQVARMAGGAEHLRTMLRLASDGEWTATSDADCLGPGRPQPHEDHIR